MSPGPDVRRPLKPPAPSRRRRSLVAVAAALVAAPALALLPAAPASAALSSPTAGSVQSGNVPVTESPGAEFGGTLYVDSLSEEGGPVPTYLDLIRHDTKVIIEGLTGSKQ